MLMIILAIILYISYNPDSVIISNQLLRHLHGKWLSTLYNTFCNGYHPISSGSNEDYLSTSSSQSSENASGNKPETEDPSPSPLSLPKTRIHHNLQL